MCKGLSKRLFYTIKSLNLNQFFTFHKNLYHASFILIHNAILIQTRIPGAMVKNCIILETDLMERKLRNKITSWQKSLNYLVLLIAFKEHALRIANNRRLPLKLTFFLHCFILCKTFNIP